MTQFKKKLTLMMVLIVALSVILAGLFAGKLLKSSYIEAQRDNMQRELSVILSMYDWQQSGSEEELTATYNSQIHYLKEAANARLTYIRSDGKVLGDSEKAPQSLDNHLDREEVREALVDGVGHSIRNSETLGLQMLYVAVPIGSPDNPEGYLRMSKDLGMVEASIRKLWAFLFGGLAVLFVISGLISYRAAHKLTRPLENMTRVAQQITHHNSQVRVKQQGNDEIGQLGQAINTMADSLQLQVNHIRQNENRLKRVLDNMLSGVMMIDHHGTIVLVNRSGEDIFGFSSEELLGRSYLQAELPSELKQRIRLCLENQESKQDEMTMYFPEEAILDVSVNPMPGLQEEGPGVLAVLHNLTAVRRLERMRSEFVANVSHELKTPVASVKGFAETLLAGAVNDPETARSFLQIIYDESERLNRLIGDILELSKIESKREPLQFSPVELETLIDQTVHVMKAEARKKNIEIKTDVAPGLFIEADEDRLRQIIINLLSNGVSYTPEGGSVSIEAEPFMDEMEEEKVRIKISDTGMGIPKKDLPRIFERFYRVDKARSRSSGGTGLGLSIVKHLIELHKGSIRVESEVGTGSVFIIELPVIHDSFGPP